MPASALEIRNLSGPLGAPVINDVSLSVPRGATHLVLGPIHSGKSMIMRHAVGLECADHGEIIIDGEHFRATGEPEPVLRRMRTRVGVVFEGSALLTRLSAIENVELPLLEHTDATADQARDAARELLLEAGLRVDDDTTPLQLGRAGQRRVALARALALRPPILLLDEPTHGLDSHSAAEFDDTLARMQDAGGFGLVIFSHEVRHAFGHAQHIYVIDNGTIVAEGDRDELRANDHPVVRNLLNRRGRP